MRLRLQLATVEQAPEISALRSAVAARLATEFGQGPWSCPGTVKGVLYDLRNSALYVARYRDEMIGTLALRTRKPWAIHLRHFTKCQKPLYLISMAIAPHLQGKGIGRLCLAEVDKIAAARTAEAIRLDAYDMPAGAETFYQHCGFQVVDRATYRAVPLVYLEKLVG